MIPPIDLSSASRNVAALLDEFGLGDVRYMVQASLWNHRAGGEAVSLAIYLGLPGVSHFRLEGVGLAETLAKVRDKLAARFGEPPPL